MAGGYDVNGHIGIQAVATSIIFVAIAGIFVAARLVVRLGMLKNAGPDDWVILGSLVFSVALTIFICAQARYGLGRHVQTISHTNYVTLLKLIWIGSPTYNLSLICTKISILLLYLRIFPGKAFRRACWIMLAFIVVYGLWSVNGTIMTCWPIYYYWTKAISDHHCQNKMALWFSIAALRIATDLVILALPMPILVSLQLQRKQKFWLMLTFALGGFVCLTSCLRLYHLYVLVKSNDLPWYNVQAAAWSSIEINVGIVCACLPTLRPLLKSAFPCLLLNASSRSGSQDPPSDRPPVNPDANHGVEVKPSTAPPHKPESVLLMKKETEKQGNSRGSRGLQEFELGILSMSTDSTSRGVTPMNSA